MQLSFETPEIRETCVDSAACERLPKDVRQTLHSRLADLRAAETLKELADIGFLQIQITETQKITLTSDYYLEVVNASPSPPRLPSGAINWKDVTRIKILGIKND